MNHFERLVVAALVHDLPELLARTAITPSEAVQGVLQLAQLDDAPGLAAVLQQAEGYALPGSRSRDELLTDRPLISIFARVQLQHTPEISYHGFAPLPSVTLPQPQLLKPLFPNSTPDGSKLVSHVRMLAEQLDWLGKSVDLSRFEHVYCHLMTLLQCYGWCLPGHSQDVTLFDHARLTSAMAAALYRYHEPDLSVEAVQAGSTAECFCLVVGDLSGIQDYIFDIATIGVGGGVARRLRARSFYLSLLADALSHGIGQRFELPLGNVIMASGGKFYVLLPNHSNIEARLNALRQEIDGWFQEHFNGEISLNLAHIGLAGRQFRASSQEQAGFGALVTELSFRLNREKRRYGQSILVKEGQWVEPAFLIERDFWGAGVCVSCGKFPGDRSDNLCRQCEQDAEVGRQLPRARYVAYYREQATGDIPLPLGCSARVLTGKSELAKVGQPYLLTKLNDPQIHELAGQPGAFRYLANHVPLDEFGVPLSFGKIAGQAEGRSLLGYVKADVDYLGILFAQGLRRDEAGYDTAAHIAALSRQLDLFFSGWMQHLLSHSSKYQHVYTIFSGGDDLFLVGPWDRAAGLAREVNDRLAAFVGGNKDITLSAGVLFTKERYPISRAARDADRVLELSKERVWVDGQGQKQTRNQLTVLGDTFPWSAAPAVFAEIEKLQERSNYLTSAFLYDLAEYGRLYRLWTEKKEIEGLRYKALFAYNIARNLRKGDVELYRWADSLMQSLTGSKHQQNLTMQYLALIATYLLFARRERS